MPIEQHPAGRVRYRGLRQWLRIYSFTVYFGGCMIIVHLTQILGLLLYPFNRPLYYSYIAKTKENFGVLVTTITQWWSPTVVRVTGDKSVRHQLKRTLDGRLECEFPERMVLTANHQLYSDWLYLWWIAYTARMHGFLYIILKESLKYVPVIGPGMQFFGFIFLARKWEQDKPRFVHRLSKLAAGGGTEPMWLLIFPEGTNLSDNGRKTSSRYAEKIGVKDLKHLMLPRSTGLRFCLENLGNSVEWLYDCTVAYEGVPRGKFGQDYFTLNSTYFEGRPPKSVNMHWRRFAVSSIPVSDTAEFEAWLAQRWREKDDFLEYYMENGRFPEDEDEKIQSNGNSNGHAIKSGIENAPKAQQRVKVGGQERIVTTTGGSTTGGWGGPIETEVKLKGLWEVFDMFKVLMTFALFANVFLKLYTIAQIFGARSSSSSSS
ncbi:acyltransferase-domain-containing protein [Choiromyces venosus 120613-1]|uniref:Acyltransferase-domain-containing protein n=1 Tax=Choiromyces venosus 120613-1 TaxID=1336337 RepID=A0A3N4J4K0_9PEZI|nr:acyltransferase-domain-containing protein [Choiromyces venosus 120613-1]